MIWISKASAACLALALAGCSGDDSADTAVDNALPAYLKNAWGIKISDFTVDEFMVEADGTQILYDEGTITVDGLGAQTLSTITLIDPAANGGVVSYLVSSADLSEERYFIYDRVENYVAFGDFTKGVAVMSNPDETYDVWAFDGDTKEQYLTVPNGYAALKVVEEYNEFKSISPHILLMAIAAAHTPVPEARIQVRCNSGLDMVAASTPVCDIFKAFCDCAACLVLDRQGTCDLCPEL